MDIQQLRNQIDSIDDQIAHLFAQRMQAAQEVAEYKRAGGQPVLDKSRERAILARVTELAGEDNQTAAKVLFNTLFDLSRSHQQAALSPASPLTQTLEQAVGQTPTFPAKALVACQGVEGAYSQMACDKLFPLADILYTGTFEGVFQAVEAGLCAFGMLPIENSAAGSVTAVYDLLRRYDAHIVRSVKLKIEHTLLAQPGVALADIREVVSHEQAIAQCSAFLKAHPHIQVTLCENTALASKQVAQSGRKDLAALASPACAALYGLSSLPQKVQDTDHNYTRFLCIAKQLTVYPGADRISLLLSLPHQPGSLYGLLARFAALGLSLTKLESRPLPGKDFEFLFYFDVLASVADPAVRALVGQLAQELPEFSFLGAYAEVF